MCLQPVKKSENVTNRRLAIQDKNKVLSSSQFSVQIIVHKLHFSFCLKHCYVAVAYVDYINNYFL